MKPNSSPNPIDGIDIIQRDWQGGAIQCDACEYRELRALPAERGCEPGFACVQDAYARRIDRFFHWHPELANAQLSHPYFEVRAIAARHADLFRLPALIDDPDETVRMQLVARLPSTQLARLVADPHREVRIRVAQRLAPEALSVMRFDPDYGVREWVARRLPLALLPEMMRDPDRVVRTRAAERLAMPALLRLINDREAEVRRVLARRLPTGLLSKLLADTDWRVRWEVARRADPAIVRLLLKDADDEVREMAHSRIAALTPLYPSAIAPAQAVTEVDHG